MRSLWRTSVYRESAVDLSQPSRLVVPYTNFIAASAIFHSAPKDVLMIGLGGGGFNQFFAKAFPSASLETVELDPAVFTAAHQYLGFKTSDKNKVCILDGRMFLRRSSSIYNWIILDAFRGGFVPPHLKTVEFYKLAKLHLSGDGIFIANVHSDTALFASDLRTIQTVFPQVGFFDVKITPNAVMVAANFKTPAFADMLKQSSQLQFNETFRQNVNIPSATGAFRMGTTAVNDRAPVLTDDFSPTEFLEAVKTNNARH